jgi:uncharacterized protein YjbI with pentapeptide repeats
MIKIRHKYTGKTLRTVNADSLSGVDLRGVDLRGVDLRGAKLRDADLSVLPVYLCLILII